MNSCPGQQGCIMPAPYPDLSFVDKAEADTAKMFGFDYDSPIYQDAGPAMSIAAGVATGVAGAARGAAGAAAKLGKAGKAVTNTAGLEARAAEIHGTLDPIAQTKRTTAVLGTREGTTVIGGGVRDLSPAQRALVRNGELLTRQPGAHAEVTVVNGAQNAQLTPQSIVTTTDICTACQQFLERHGASIIGPRSAGW
jgi:hypothetical protein